MDPACASARGEGCNSTGGSRAAAEASHWGRERRSFCRVPDAPKARAGTQLVGWAKPRARPHHKSCLSCGVPTMNRAIRVNTAGGHGARETLPRGEPRASAFAHPTPQLGLRPRRIVWALAGDGHVVHMAF